MQIVINIPKEIYETLNGIPMENISLLDLLDAVRAGVVLPKGHGRLIDADKLLDALRSNVAVVEYSGIEKAEDDLEESPTVLDADKENEN